jgi:pimeloyl-ACP methyl ester carboxylesterase
MRRTDQLQYGDIHWYHDAETNKGASVQARPGTRVLYLRAEKEGGHIDDFVSGLRAAGLTQVEPAVVPNAGHFTQEEAPEDTWRLIADLAAG